MFQNFTQLFIHNWWRRREWLSLTNFQIFFMRHEWIELLFFVRHEWIKSICSKPKQICGREGRGLFWQHTVATTCQAFCFNNMDWKLVWTWRCFADMLGQISTDSDEPPTFHWEFFLSRDSQPKWTSEIPKRHQRETQMTNKVPIYIYGSFLILQKQKIQFQLLCVLGCNCSSHKLLTTCCYLFTMRHGGLPAKGKEVFSFTTHAIAITYLQCITCYHIFTIPPMGAKTFSFSSLPFSHVEEDWIFIKTLPPLWIFSHQPWDQFGKNLPLFQKPMYGC